MLCRAMGLWRVLCTRPDLGEMGLLFLYQCVVLSGGKPPPYTTRPVHVVHSKNTFAEMDFRVLGTR